MRENFFTLKRKLPGLDTGELLLFQSGLLSGLQLKPLDNFSEPPDRGTVSVLSKFESLGKLRDSHQAPDMRTRVRNTECLDTLPIDHFLASHCFSSRLEPLQRLLSQPTIDLSRFSQAFIASRISGKYL
jgi:hypothetical protein